MKPLLDCKVVRRSVVPSLAQAKSALFLALFASLVIRATRIYLEFKHGSSQG
jgi:hypothetical protein